MGPMGMMGLSRQLDLSTQQKDEMKGAFQAQRDQQGGPGPAAQGRAGPSDRALGGRAGSGKIQQLQIDLNQAQQDALSARIAMELKINLDPHPRAAAAAARRAGPGCEPHGPAQPAGRELGLDTVRRADVAVLASTCTKRSRGSPARQAAHGAAREGVERALGPRGVTEPASLRQGSGGPPELQRRVGAGRAPHPGRARRGPRGSGAGVGAPRNDRAGVWGRAPPEIRGRVTETAHDDLDPDAGAPGGGGRARGLGRARPPPPDAHLQLRPGDGGRHGRLRPWKISRRRSSFGAYRAIGRFRGDSAFRTWLFRIATNAVRTHLGRRGRWRALCSAPPAATTRGPRGATTRRAARTWNRTS